MCVCVCVCVCVCICKGIFLDQISKYCVCGTFFNYKNLQTGINTLPQHSTSTYKVVCCWPVDDVIMTLYVVDTWS